MLVKCKECDLQVSDKALACPHCGCPVGKNTSMTPKRTRRNKRKKLPNGFGRITEIKGQNLRKPFRAMVTVEKDESGRMIGKLLNRTHILPHIMKRMRHYYGTTKIRIVWSRILR